MRICVEEGSEGGGSRARRPVALRVRSAPREPGAIRGGAFLFGVTA